jgi:hypothetical protein
VGRRTWSVAPGSRKFYGHQEALFMVQKISPGQRRFNHIKEKAQTQRSCCERSAELGERAHTCHMDKKLAAGSMKSMTTKKVTKKDTR